MIRKISFFLIFLLLFLCFSMPSYATEKEIVKVGYYEYPYFQEIDDKGNYSGYSYDYLQTIAQYTGWKYKFITYATATECLDMLEKGQIDLMGVVKKTPEREKVFDFPEYPSSESSTYLVTDKDNKSYAYEDFEMFDNMTVALQEAFARNDGLKDYCKKNGFSVKTKTYDTIEKFSEAIKSGEVDAALISSNKINPNYRIIARFDPDETYYITTKGNSKVLNGLNSAISQIKTENLDFDSDLYNKYYNFSSGQEPVLSKDEEACVKKHKKLRVVYDVDHPPFEFKNGKGKASGISIGVMEKISKAVGIDFEYVPAKNQKEKQKMIEKGKCDIVATVTHDYNWANRNKLFVSQPYLSSDYVCIYKKIKKKNISLALPEGYYISEYLEPNTQKYGKITYYKSIGECVQAVKNGKADYTFTNIYECEYFLSQPRYRTLAFRSMQLNKQEFSIGTIDNDPLLYSILSKGLKSITDAQMYEIIQLYANHSEKAGFFDIMHTNPSQFLLIIGVLVVLILSLIVLLALNRVNRKKQQLLKTAVTMKSDFLSSMSHDMRTPMNAIIGMSYLGLESTKLDESKKYHSQINKSGNYLLNLINDTLDMNKIEQNKMTLHLEPYYSKEFVQSIKSLLGNKAYEKGVKFSIYIKTDTEKALSFDKLRLQQIFINLINNAIKFTPSGGTVKFIVDVSPHIKNNMIDVTFKVCDNGIGMSEAFQKKMYEPFEQEKRGGTEADSGTGLGLSIVYRIVTLMNGKIYCHSEEGKGTEFIIKLSAMVSDEKQLNKSKPDQKIVDNVCLQQKQILLVEDHPLNVQISKKILERKGVIVHHAENGKVALDMFLKSDDYFYDAILMDIQMPIMNGIEATNEIRKLNSLYAKDVPIIAMTANAFDEDIEKSLGIGMNAHLAKPIEPNQLYETLRTFICKEKHINT